MFSQNTIIESLSLKKNIIKDIRKPYRLKQELNYTPIKDIKNLFRRENETKVIKDIINLFFIIN